MIRHSRLLGGASFVVLGLLATSAANAQQALPTINIGGARAAVIEAPRAAPLADRDAYRRDVDADAGAGACCGGSLRGAEARAVQPHIADEHSGRYREPHASANF